MNQLKEFYQQKNMESKDTQMLASISKSSITSIESSINALTNLLENLKTYKQCMIDSFTLLSESTDINPITTFTQSHTLPGVVSVPQVIKSESNKREQINTNKDKALRQKRIYMRLVEKDSNHYFQAFKGLQHNDAAFEEYLEILNGNIDLNLQPNRLDNSPSEKKPNIKLSVSQEL